MPFFDFSGNVFLRHSIRTEVGTSESVYIIDMSSCFLCNVFLGVLHFPLIGLSQYEGSPCRVEAADTSASRPEPSFCASGCSGVLPKTNLARSALFSGSQNGNSKSGIFRDGAFILSVGTMTNLLATRYSIPKSLCRFLYTLMPETRPINSLAQRLLHLW